MMKQMDDRTRFESDFQGAVSEMFDHFDTLNTNFIELYEGLQTNLPDMWQSVQKDHPSK